VICLAGPTAAGKSAACMALAQRWPLEVINVDSATIYRGMDVGTAKPSADERARVPQHLLDIRDPAQTYSAAQFRADTLRLIEAIRGRNRLPLLAGGTMLYYKVLRDGLDDLPQADPALRAELEARAAEQGWPALHAELAKRDPATARMIEPVLYFKGFHALQTYRVAHVLWQAGRKDFALYLQSLSSRVFQVDIHPAAKIGKGVMFDHATGIVIGETAVIGDNCSLLHGVTLGGTGNEKGDRHPKIGRGVMMGSGAKILGNITVGDCARIAAGSVVLKDVPPRTTVAGVPAREIGFAGCEEPALAMDQFFQGEGEPNH